MTLDPIPRLLAFAGSTRTESYNKKLVKVAAQGARDVGAEVTFLDLRDYPLPLFDEDLETAEGLPDNARKLKDLFLGHHGFLISTPSYNSSISGVLKNTIDWVSRPVPDEAYLGCFTGKVASIMAASPSAFGGITAVAALRSILSYIGVFVLPGEINLINAHEQFAEDGTFKAEKWTNRAAKLGIDAATIASRMRA